MVDTKFQVRIAHGTHDLTTKTLTWQVYPDTYPARINNTIVITWYGFIWKFKSSGYDLHFPHIEALLDIDGDGKWAVATN